MIFSYHIPLKTYPDSMPTCPPFIVQTLHHRHICGILYYFWCLSQSLLFALHTILLALPELMPTFCLTLYYLRCLSQCPLFALHTILLMLPEPMLPFCIILYYSRCLSLCPLFALHTILLTLPDQCPLFASHYNTYVA